MKYLIILLLSIISFQGFPEKVSKEKAKIVAENWVAMKLKLAKNDIEKGQCYTDKKDTSLYVFNFKYGGFVIVPSDDHTCPILAYSNENHINLEQIEPVLQDMLSYYTDMIKYNKSEPKEKDIKKDWEEIEACVSLKSVQTTVPSLFESTHSSRWAYWRPYFNQAPPAQLQFNPGHSGCVPIAISQIMKYFKYPLIGTGTGSGHINNSYFTQNINSFFDYDQMPFQLTYCGNGENNCNDGSFNLIPGVTPSQIDEVGKLQYNAGLAVGMYWIGMGDTATTSTGTTGFTLDWANDMANHFYYTLPTSSDYWSSSEITASTSDFKSGIISSLNSGYPVLFRYESRLNGGGHLLVIDGYENDNYFHFAMGDGGYLDAYYYLFSSDDDGVHLPRPQINLWGLNACLNIHPYCPPNQNVTVTNKTISNDNGELIQSGNDLFVDHTTIQSGGRAVLQATHAITISNDFEVALGGEVWIVCRSCSN